MGHGKTGVDMEHSIGMTMAADTVQEGDFQGQEPTTEIAGCLSSLLAPGLNLTGQLSEVPFKLGSPTTDTSPKS